ncbi:F0F1 ATP synthase subunit B' [Pseudoruegeria sp. SK021]|uniref:F0F1 ATP synthase subunit B' n=1 Tax=Pseudoruegeria sp. SK021 TaxID=1933035 RepID=UPI000A24A6DE|nr:F0F1 ATP synthase subunit B' [Pseudoruegeria sp. SK021]OSP56583.1 ATP F0F1 synthase subunit B' [Pseudoruegeria sp. SK021]
MAETTHAAAGTAHSAADAVAHGSAATQSAGMPQLEFAHFPNQIFWLVIALGALYYILSRVALPRIASILADRQGRIMDDIAAAEQLKLKAEEAETAYQKALADARAESNRIIAEARAEVQVELDAAIAKADAEIAAKAAESERSINEIRAGAIDSIEAVAKDTAGAIVAAFGTGADDAVVADAVNARLKG